MLLVEGSDEWGVLSSSVVSGILEYMWKPRKVFITSRFNKPISKQTAINISLKFLKNASLSPEGIELIVYPAHPDFTSYHVYNTTSGKEIGFLEQLIKLPNNIQYIWLVFYKIENKDIALFVDGNSGAIMGVMENVRIYRPHPKIM